MRKVRFALLTSIAIVLILVSAFTNTIQAVEIIKSIPLNGRPTLAYDSYKGAIWLTTWYSYVNEFGMHVSDPTGTISAISDSNYATLANITLGYDLGPIAYDSALHEIYVAKQASGTISVISDTTNSIVATIDLHTNSGNGVITGMVYDSGKGEMFVSSYVFGGIFVISDKTKQVVATIPLGNDPYPTGLIYDSGKGEIYVSYQGLPEKNPANFMSVISDATNSVIATVPLGNGIPFNAPVGPGSYDSATDEIYMVNSINSSVLVISDETHTVVDSIQLEPSPMSVGYDPAKRVLFVGTAYNTTYIISDKTKSIVETVPISCFYTFYDSGKGVMIALSGASSLQFISDASLPSVSPTSTVPEFPALAILPLLLVLLLIGGKISHRKSLYKSLY